MTYSPFPTSFQLTHLLQRVYDKLEQTKGITATGGTTSTIIDTTLSADYQDFSDFDGAYCFIERDAGGANAAPEGEYAKVTGYATSTKTLSFAASSFTVAPASGDRVLIAQGSLFPFNDVLRKCNIALQNLGDVVNINTSLTTASNQTEYTVPSGVPYRSIVDVRYQYNTGDSNDNEYKSLRYKIIPDSSIGGANAIIEIEQVDSGRTLQIWSIRPHATLSSYADPISIDIHPSLAVAACALEAANINRQASAQQGLLDKLQAELAVELLRHPLRKYIPKVYGMLHWTPGMQSGYPGDQSIYDR